MNDKKNSLELEKRIEEPLTYNPPRMSGEWQFNEVNFANSGMAMVSNGICGDGVGPSCSSGTAVDSLGSAVWENLVDTGSLGFNEMNVHSGGRNASDPLSMLRGGMFIPSMSEILPDNLSQFPADSAFIERAARFSSFSGGHFGDLLSPFCMQQSGNPYSRDGTLLSGNANVADTSKDVPLPSDHGVVDVSSSMNEAMARRSYGEATQGVSVSENGSDDPQYSGGGTREESTPSSTKALGAKKRKRNIRDAESEQGKGVQQQSGEAGEKISEIQQKGEQNSASTINKSSGKQTSQTSDPPKDDYIHVRARRGQATNSHSLAERVRREKISERMKYLQDLVPGCNKVTGKAVMLDEIINYVQSLQRQVEFLSMKLATVNPRLDFNIEQLLAKDHMLSARSGIGISPNMPMAYPTLHPSQPFILQPGHPGSANCSDLLRRTINSQSTNMGGGYKEPTNQGPNPWEDELHNIVQMGFDATDPLDNQEINCSAAQGSMKAEP